jgi:site-specific recombinase XerD
MVPVQRDVAQFVRNYLQATGRRLGDDGPLFRAHDRAARKLPRARLTVRAVAYVVERIAAGAGIAAKTISPHSARHTYALRALRNGGNVVAVSKLLGHANVTTTTRYVDHLQLAELRQAVPPLPLQG